MTLTAAKSARPVKWLLTAGVAAILTASAALPAFAQDATEGEGPDPFAGRTSDEVYADLRLFGQVFDRIRSEYVDVPDERELIRAAIDGMLSSLDPHSGYLSPENFGAVQEDTTGEFGGLGIEVTMEEGIVRVVNPIEDTPAERAGILANDYIIKLDGVPVLGQTMDEAVGTMRGIVGTEITVTLLREGIADPFDVTLERGFIPQRVVRWILDRDVGIMQLDRFSEQAYTGIKEAIEDMIAERDGELPAGLVLDLRNNPGGLVDQSVFVADAFLSEGAIVITRGRTEQESARYDANPDDLDELIRDVPLVVLINGGSASASEILAGALQDQRRATIVGTRSYGKGSVQSIISLAQNGAMRLTTARYYTPSNRSIQAAGIYPDIIIEQNVPEEFQGRDEVIGEAALAGQIGGGTDEEATTGSSVYVPRDRTQDTQLNYAIGLILGTETNPAFPPDPDN